MKIDYRKETATMLRALRKEGYSNSDLIRKTKLVACYDDHGYPVSSSEDSFIEEPNTISNKLYQSLISRALEVGYKDSDKLYVIVEEGEDEYSGYLYASVSCLTKVCDREYYYTISGLYKDAKLMSEREEKKRSVEELLGSKITEYTLTQLQSIFK